MKKLFTILIGLMFCLILSAQNEYKYEIKAKGGLSIGVSETKIDSAVHNPTTDQFILFQGADTTDIYVKVANRINLKTVAPLLTDTVPVFVFGAGSGLAADSTLFAKGQKGFGAFNVVDDTLYVVNVDNLFFSSGDSLKFNVYYGNRMTGVAVDSLFDAVQACGTYQSTLTPDNHKIPEGSDVWLELKSDQITGKRPKEWVLQLNGYKIIKD